MQIAKKARQFALSMAMLVSAGMGPALAQTMHLVAPKGAQITCSGTRGQETCPWNSVEMAIQSGMVKGGDTLLLMDGQHDRIDIEGRNFVPPITIESVTNQNAIVDTVFLRTASGVTFRDLTIQSSGANPYPLFHADFDTSIIAIENSKLQSTASISNVLSWTAADWLSRRRHGVWLYGSNSRALNNTIDTVQSGIWSGGTNNQIIGNKITNLTGDALRAGSATIVGNNYVANFFRVDDDHIDGFQSIGSVDKPVRGLRLRRNTIIEWTYPGDHPLRTSAQGIGMFDGFYDDFSIRNNVVAVSAYHGIAVYGGRNGIITNNTVVHPSVNSVNFPWIGVFNHKNGTPSTNVIVANNLAMSFSGASATNNVILMDNQVIIRPSDVFQNAAAFDYRPNLASGFIDTGNPLYTPKTDIDGILRPQGSGPDKGAYEIRAAGETQPRRKVSDTTQKTQTMLAASSEEDVVPAMSAPKRGDETDTAADAEAGERIYANQKPIRLRQFWTDGASQ